MLGLKKNLITNRWKVWKLNPQSTSSVIKEYKKTPWKIKRFLSTRGGTWTRTDISVHWILSPACLPIPPPEQNDIYLNKKRWHSISAYYFERKTAPTLRGNLRPLISRFYSWAKNGIRTRDLNLGKVALYQLSYFRI